MSSKTISAICNSIIIIAFINFIIFGVNSSKLGGSALGGKTENSRYFVSESGIFTEVSKQEYESLRTQEIALIITWSLGMAGLFYLNRDNIRFFGKRIDWRKSKKRKSLD